MAHVIDLSPITPEMVWRAVQENERLELSEEARQRIINCRAYLDKKLEESESPIYGINTGFGSLCNTSISRKDLAQLQKNLVLSHACGMGEEVPVDIVRLMLYLKIRSLSYGHSGVEVATVEMLIALYNSGINPVVFEMGSLGASGDLAPLAHMSLPLFGEGQVWYKGKKCPALEALQNENLQPLNLRSKEGLALLNGTQFMSAYGVMILTEAYRLLRWAERTASLSLEAFDGKTEPFLPQVHRIRNHEGQIDVAARILDILKGSEMAARKKINVQDPYSFRCVPQVHGAVSGALDYANSVFTAEVNAVTDNPTLFPEEDLLISAGNFHGEPLALAHDHLALALSELGSISERRIYKLLSGTRELPPFLVASPGLNSGFMIPQYTAASMVSQNKQLCHPASVDTIDSSNGQEDHVSMGANAATRTFRVLENLRRIIAIELLTAAQAFEFRRPIKTSPELEALLADFRKEIPFVKQDQLLHPLMQAAETFIKQNNPNKWTTKN